MPVGRHDRSNGQIACYSILFSLIFAPGAAHLSRPSSLGAAEEFHFGSWFRLEEAEWSLRLHGRGWFDAARAGAVLVVCLLAAEGGRNFFLVGLIDLGDRFVALYLRNS